MKKFKLIFLCYFLLQTPLFAQQIASTEILKLAANINRLQTYSDNKTYTDLRDNQVYTVSFSKDNFNVLLSTKLAYKSVYKQWDGREVLAVTENIDLSKVQKIEKFLSPGNTNALIIRLYFPKGSIKTTLIEKGTVITTVSEDFLEFFYPETEEGVGKKMMVALYRLVILMKEAKGVNVSNDYAELGMAVFQENHDTEQAKIYYKKAIDAGNTYAIYLMSSIVDKNDQNKWMQLAIEKEDPTALAFHAFRQDDYSSQRKLLLAAVAKGSVVAMGFMAFVENQSNNYTAQLEWYEKAYQNREKVSYRYSIYDALLNWYTSFGLYEKLKVVIDNPDIYSSGIEKDRITVYKAILTAVSGNGDQAVANLLQVANTTNNKKLVVEVYDQLTNIYEKGIGLKKNKKLRELYSQKRTDAWQQAYN